MRLPLQIALIFSCLISCTNKVDSTTNSVLKENEVYEPYQSKKEGVELVVLGTTQDAGSPQINCTQDCCKELWDAPDEERKIVSLGIIDWNKNQTFIIEATPDFPEQMALLHEEDGLPKVPSGIFLTHAHIGHYTGLMYLGKEAMDAKLVPVYCMSRMAGFLEDNGPWSQLVDNDNIAIKRMVEDSTYTISSNIAVQPIKVPHRDEFSETVGFIINGPKKSVLFIPDINKWEEWDAQGRAIEALIMKVDYAFLDATFYDANELPGRSMEEVPHPFVKESMRRFDELNKTDKSKIFFIHLNHTNPLLNEDSDAYQNVINSGYQVAEFGQRINL